MVQDAEMAQDLRSRFEVLYREHGAHLWRGVVLFAGDLEIANDAVAEAFAQAINRGDELRSPIAWITKAAYRIAAGELKARRLVGYPLVDAPHHDMPEQTLRLADALAQLSPKQRAAALLHFRDGYTLAETAEIIGSTTAAVGVHLHRARKRLIDLLGDDDA
jgi:RNA polymerase sigma-70 factor, ECF subfamily